MMLPVAVIRAREVGPRIVGTDLAGAFGEPCLWGNLKFEMKEGDKQIGVQSGRTGGSV
jgi:hypothetical protein